MKINKKPIDINSLNPEAVKALKTDVKGVKPFKVENIKKWFGGQTLHVVYKDYVGLKEMPAELDNSPAAKIVDLLDRVWLENKEVVEGMVGDLMHGSLKDIKHRMKFEEARAGILDLRKKGYIAFSDSKGNLGEQAWTNLAIHDIWFRLTPKFEKLIVARPI